MDDTSFDAVAASLRATTTDLGAFLEALAAKLELSFPERVRVERGGGHLGRPRRVRTIAVELGDRVYELESDDSKPQCRWRKVVGGIALKTETLALDDWLQELARTLTAVAGESERGALALQRLLEDA